MALRHGSSASSFATIFITNGYGISGITDKTFELKCSAATSYTWRAGTYKWVTIKIS